MTTTQTPNTFTTTVIGDDSEYGLFEQIDNDGTMRCTVCGSTDSMDAETIPSMYAGEETTLICGVCGSSEYVSDPFKGTRKVERRDGIVLDIPTASPSKLVARGGFLHPTPDEKEFQYGTDPTTLLDVRAGDRVAVHMNGTTHTFIVERVGRDHFGLYLHGKQWDDAKSRYYSPLAPYAATTVHHITRVA